MGGFAGAGAVGFGAYTKREEIGKGYDKVRRKLKFAWCEAKVTIIAFVTQTERSTVERAMEAQEKATTAIVTAKDKTVTAAIATKQKTVEIVTDKAVQKTAASAVGGAVVLGTGGAATGLATGGAVGAAVGLVPALFTFGLSIPVCAVIGSGCGMVTGATVGGTTGAVAGAGGYQAYVRRESIKSAAGALADKTRTSVGDLGTELRTRSGNLGANLRSRLTRSATA